MVFVRRFWRIALTFAAIFLAALQMLPAVQSTTKRNTVYADDIGAAVSPNDLYPLGDMRQKEIVSLPFEQAAGYPLSATASVPNRRLRALAVTPIVGGNRYGYNWLGTASGFSADERNVMVGIYEALDKWAVDMYNGTDDFILDGNGGYSTGGRIDFDAAIQAQLPLDGDINATFNSANTNRSLRLVFLAYGVFQLDNPQYYQMLPEYPALFPNSGKTKITAIVPTLSADCVLYADRQKIQSRIDNEYQTYFDLINLQKATDPYDVVRLVHDMICAKTDYSYIPGSGSNPYIPDTNEPAHDIRGVMDPISTGPVCESYAESFTYIINRLGIAGLEAVTVVGTAGSGGNGGGGGHAWNMVSVKGAWYFLDITWDNLDNTNPNSAQYDDGNKLNLLYYKFFLNGTGNADWGHGSTHKPADSAPKSITNGYFSFGLPTASSADYNRPPVSRKDALPQGVSRYLTDNGFYGKNGLGVAAFNTKAAHDDYDYIVTKTAKPYSGSAADNPLIHGTNVYYGPYNLGTYYKGKPVPLYLFPYSNGAGSVSLAFDDYADEPNAADYAAMGAPVRVPLTEGTDYTVAAEPGNTGDEVRIWFYGAGGNYRGVDFALVTLEAAPPTPPQADTAVNLAGIDGITAPAAGGVPVATVTETAQYTGAVVWSPTVSGSFGFDTVYTAVITLTAKQGFTLQGVPANFFTVAGATAVNTAGSGTVTAVFPKTAANQQIQIDRDNADIAAAKNKVESAAYTAAHTECPDGTAALARIDGIISGLNLDGVTYSINQINYVPAAAGTEAAPNGTDGELKFAVTLNKGAGAEVITVNLTLTITAAAYTPPNTDGTAGGEAGTGGGTDTEDNTDTGDENGAEGEPDTGGKNGTDNEPAAQANPHALYIVVGATVGALVLLPMLFRRKKGKKGKR